MAGVWSPCFVILSALAVTRGLHLTRGAYEDLVVKISDDIPRDRCREVITNLEVSCNRRHGRRRAVAVALFHPDEHHRPELRHLREFISGPAFFFPIPITRNCQSNCT